MDRTKRGWDQGSVVGMAAVGGSAEGCSLYLNNNEKREKEKKNNKISLFCLENGSCIPVSLYV